MSRERLFRFNPFTIQNEDDSKIIEEYSRQEEDLRFSDTPGDLAHDIDTYANMGYLIGEMIARYSYTSSNTEATLKVSMSNQIYRERDQWSKEHDEKTPAMSYFESRAISMHLKEIEAQNKLDSQLKRFKFAYDSLQDKQNALKKKMDAVKYDLSNQ